MADIDLCVEEIDLSGSIMERLKPGIDYAYKKDHWFFFTFVISYSYVNNYAPINVLKSPEEFNFSIERAIDNALLKTIYPRSSING